MLVSPKEGAEGPSASAVANNVVMFTWNLRQSMDALKLACTHLAKLGPFVAALQELPSNVDSGLIQELGDNKLKLLSRSMPKKNENLAHPAVVLLASNDIDIDQTGRRHEYDVQRDSERRLEGLPLRSNRWQNLQVLGVHAWDRSRPRGQWTVLMRDVLSAFWNGTDPIVVLGDLNAHPWSPEITGRHGLYALRWKDWPARGHGKLAGREQYMTPLYNPMWQILPDGATGGHGTLFYPKHDLSWRCFDQIIVSQHLRESISPPTVLTSLGDRNLVNKKDRPKKRKSKPEISDHLPVQLTMDLGKVAPCKVSAKC